MAKKPKSDGNGDAEPNDISKPIEEHGGYEPTVEESSRPNGERDSQED